jgi:hypothetical protein
VYATASLTGEAALLSGTPRKDRGSGATGGLLRKVGEYGILVLKDFGSVLALHREARSQVLAALREVYDGSWQRDLGVDGGRRLSWQGKLGLVAGCVPTLDQHYAVMGTLGDRFCLYRLAVDEASEQALRSLDHIGGIGAVRSELRESVQALFAGLELDPAALALTPEDRTRLAALSVLVVRARSTVLREAYQSREVELVPDAEAPGRLVVQLGLLRVGLRLLGLPDTTAWDVTRKTALDSMPALRRQVLERLVTRDGRETTSAVAVELDLPTTTVRRVLEDLTAHGVLTRESASKGKADTWETTPWTRQQWKAGE